MLHKLAISGYRSLKEIIFPLGQLNLITGPNGCGKSSVYRSLRLLAESAEGGLIRSLAREGGLQSTLWAGPEKFSPEMIRGDAPVQGGPRKKPISLRLGFASDDFSYCLDLGLPPPADSAFRRDPMIKRECIWRGPMMRQRDLCVDRRALVVRCRPERSWEEVNLPLTPFASILTEYADPLKAPELLLIRDAIRSWRFYDHMRTDTDAPARRAEIGTFTPVLAGDGSDLAAALQTIREIGDSLGMNEVIDDAFPGSQLAIRSGDARFSIQLTQPGLLRPLSAAELSDGTLRYLMLVAAMMTPRPPELMVLNEPETSLHPELLPPLGRLITRFASEHQVFVVTHSQVLIDALTSFDQCAHFELEKELGATKLAGVDPFDLPQWKWPAR